MVQEQSNVQALIYSIEYQINSAFDMFLSNSKKFDFKGVPALKTPKMNNAKTQTESQRPE